VNLVDRKPQEGPVSSGRLIWAAASVIVGRPYSASHREGPVENIETRPLRAERGNQRVQAWDRGGSAAV